jgi:hypothetical protein
MPMDVIQTVVYAVVLIICLVITKFVIPFVKSKLSESDLSTIEWWVDKAVQAAEEKWKEAEKAGDSKHQFVVNFLTSHGINVTDEQLTILIKSAVKAMNDAKVLTEG